MTLTEENNLTREQLLELVYKLSEELESYAKHDCYDDFDDAYEAGHEDGYDSGFQAGYDKCLEDS